MDWIYEDGRIYSLDESNALMAETTFIFTENGEVDINHTYVNPTLRGQGIAGEMMIIVAEYLKENKLKASATCSYANAWLKRYKESYPDIISQNIDSAIIACKIDAKH